MGQRSRVFLAAFRQRQARARSLKCGEVFSCGKACDHAFSLAPRGAARAIVSKPTSQRAAALNYAPAFGGKLTYLYYAFQAARIKRPSLGRRHFSRDSDDKIAEPYMPQITAVQQIGAIFAVSVHCARLAQCVGCFHFARVAGI